MCTQCDCPYSAVHQEEHRYIRHLDVWGKKTWLHFTARRFRCEHCGRTFTEQLQSLILIGDNRWHSRNMSINHDLVAHAKLLQFVKVLATRP